MMLKKLMSAAVAGVLSVTSLALPTAYDQLSAVVTAAETKDDTIKQDKLPYTLITGNPSASSTMKGNFEIPNTMKKSKNITISIEGPENYTENVSVSVYGYGISAAPWWVDMDSLDGTLTYEENLVNGKMEITTPVPEELQGKITKIGFGVFWPQSGKRFTVTSIEGDVISDPEEDPDPVSGDAELYVSKNDKSGVSSFVDNKDGTAAVTATLAAQYQLNKETEFSVALNDRSKSNYEFDLKNFGIDDIENVKFQSFQFVVRTKSTDTYIKELQYKGDISVKPAEGSTKTTYTDEEAYTAKNCGNYAKLVWDVPADVQPTVDGSGSVGFNFESAVDTSDNDISNITIESCTAVYTKTMTVPYNETISDTTAKEIAIGKKVNLQLEDLLKLSRHDNFSAVKFTFTSEKNMQKFVSGLGISLDEDKTGETWYDSGNFCVLDPEKEFTIMWIPTKEIQASIWGGKTSKIQFGYWYGDDQEGKKVSPVTLKSVDYYLYRFPERDNIITDSKDKEIIKKVELGTDEEFPVKTSIEGSTFESSDPTIASITETGVITTHKEGTATITIKTPAGQEEKFDVIVSAEPVVTTAATTPAPVSTTTTTVSSDGPADITTKATTTTENGATDVTTNTTSDAPVATTPAKETTVSTESSTTSKTTSATAKPVSTTSATKSEPAKTTKASTTPDDNEPAKTTTTTAPVIDIDPSTITYGDVNLDGVVDLADVTWLAKYLLSSASYPLGNKDALSKAQAEASADMNGDKIIDSRDLSRLIEFNLGKLSLSDLKPKK